MIWQDTKHAVLKGLLNLGRQDHPAASLHWALYQEGVQVLPITSSQLAVEPKTCQSEVQEANKNLVTLGYKSTKVNHNLKTDIVLCFLPAVFKHITTHLSGLASLYNSMNNNNNKKTKNLNKKKLTKTRRLYRVYRATLDKQMCLAQPGIKIFTLSAKAAGYGRFVSLAGSNRLQVFVVVCCFRPSSLSLFCLARLGRAQCVVSQNTCKRLLTCVSLFLPLPATV